MRCLSFLQLDDNDNVWAHPIDGVVAYVDLITAEVVELIDERRLPAPDRAGGLPAGRTARCPQRTTQRPIEITQPEGPSFTRRGQTSCAGRTGSSGSASTRSRASPCTRSASRTAAGSARSSTAPRSPRWWCRTATRHRSASGRTTSTPGEYSLGKEANALKLGLRLPRRDPLLRRGASPTTTGNPRVIENAICMHEEDYGVLWKHTDMYNRHQLHPPAAPAGDLVLHHRRQLRLRLLLVPLPRRHDRAGVQGDRRGLRLGVPGSTGRTARRTRGRRRSRPASGRRTTSTCSRRGWT